MDESELIRKFFATAFPNPDRVGCPEGRVLLAIARNTLPADDPARLHLASCSPCFSEVQEARTQLYKEASRRKKRALAVAAAVTIVGAIAGSVLWTVRDQRYELEPGARAPYGKTVSPKDAPADQERAKGPGVTPFEVTLDLRPWSQTRGGEDVKRPLLRVPARLVRARLMLPLGSDDGRYDLEIRAIHEANELRSGKGNAVIRNGETQLEVEFDLSGIPAGTYALLYRHADASWRNVPIVIY